MTSLAVGRGLEDLEQPAMPSLAVGRELEDLELWLAGLFTAQELAAAELLLQLSLAGADDKAAASTSNTPSPTPRCASPCSDNLTVEEKQQQEEQVVEETALPLASAELDMRVRKRYRRLSELYAATVPVTSLYNTSKKREMHHDHHGSSSVVEATRYGGGHY